MHYKVAFNNRLSLYDGWIRQNLVPPHTHHTIILMPHALRSAPSHIIKLQTVDSQNNGLHCASFLASHVTKFSQADPMRENFHTHTHTPGFQSCN